MKAARALERIDTPRLLLRRPRRRDAQAIFTAYASDPEVTRYLTWRTHASLADTQAFLDASDRGWSTGSELTFLAWEGDALVGASGLTQVGGDRLRTGYLVARPRWRQGIASELVQAMLQVAFEVQGASAVEALVEPGHEASTGVLVKAGFVRDGSASGVHPNLGPEVRELDRFVRLRQI
jgi:RimJ/RimL family protein N-acetyltransferase